MLLGEIFSVALASLRANKLRSLLTMLGIVIGVASVIAMIALGNGAENAVKDRIKEMMVQKANGDFITKIRESAKVERMDQAPPATPATPPAAEKKK